MRLVRRCRYERALPAYEISPSFAGGYLLFEGKQERNKGLFCGKKEKPPNGKSKAEGRFFIKKSANRPANNAKRDKRLHRLAGGLRLRTICKQAENGGAATRHGSIERTLLIEPVLQRRDDGQTAFGGRL